MEKHEHWQNLTWHTDVITEIINWEGELRYRSELNISLHDDEYIRQQISITPDILRQWANDLEQKMEEARKEQLIEELAELK